MGRKKQGRYRPAREEDGTSTPSQPVQWGQNEDDTTVIEVKGIGCMSALLLAFSSVMSLASMTPAESRPGCLAVSWRIISFTIVLALAIVGFALVCAAFIAVAAAFTAAGVAVVAGSVGGVLFAGLGAFALIVFSTSACLTGFWQLITGHAVVPPKLFVSIAAAARLPDTFAHWLLLGVPLDLLAKTGGSFGEHAAFVALCAVGVVARVATVCILWSLIGCCLTARKEAAGLKNAMDERDLEGGPTETTPLFDGNWTVTVRDGATGEETVIEVPQQHQEQAPEEPQIREYVAEDREPEDPAAAEAERRAALGLKPWTPPPRHTVVLKPSKSNSSTSS